jgi:nucleoside-triphosphatase THEP1
MFDAECDLAALVYDQGDEPDAVLRDFARGLQARGVRAVGLVQRVHRGHDQRDVAAMLVHSGVEIPLLQRLGRHASGCRLDVGRLLQAGSEVASALSEGADLLIINRFGRQESEGGGLTHLIEQALASDVPVVIAVSRFRFAEWIRFAQGMSVRLRCDRHALDDWWRSVSRRDAVFAEVRPTICEMLK